MLIVAPTGITNREILGSMLLFSSTQRKVTGIVALEESVPNAVAIAAGKHIHDNSDNTLSH